MLIIETYSWMSLEFITTDLKEDFNHVLSTLFESATGINMYNKYIKYKVYTYPWRILLNLSNITLHALLLISDNRAPQCLMKPTATSTESSVGRSIKRVRICKAIIS